MILHNDHIVHKLKLNLKTDDNRPDLLGKIGRICQEQLPNSLGLLCDNHIPVDEKVHIKKLTLDLGKISEKTLESDFHDVCKQQFLKALEKCQGTSNKSDGTYQDISAVTNLDYFIQHGRIHPRFDKQKLSVHEILNLAADDDVLKVGDLIINYISLPITGKRIVFHFSDKQLLDALDKKEKYHSLLNFFKQLPIELQQLVGKAGNPRRVEMRLFMWDKALSFCQKQDQKINSSLPTVYSEILRHFTQDRLSIESSSENRSAHSLEAYLADSGGYDKEIHSSILKKALEEDCHALKQRLSSIMRSLELRYVLLDRFSNEELLRILKKVASETIGRLATEIFRDSELISRYGRQSDNQLSRVTVWQFLFSFENHKKLEGLTKDLDTDGWTKLLTALQMHSGGLSDAIASAKSVGRTGKVNVKGPKGNALDDSVLRRSLHQSKENIPASENNDSILSPWEKASVPNNTAPTNPDNSTSFFSSKDLETIPISNSGLVLLWPHIPTLFDQIRLLNNGKFIDEEHQFKAIHLIEYLAHNQVSSTEEQYLTLNKLLCGIDISHPVPPHIAISPEEMVACHDFMESIISEWTAIGNSSVESIQESFIRRSGILAPIEYGWQLRIERQTLDILVDQLPWGIGVVKLPWMKSILFVDW